MEISHGLGEKIVAHARTYLGTAYTASFRCVDFVRLVYANFGIKIPKLRPCMPPRNLNVSLDQIDNLPLGHPLFLKDREDPRTKRAWTHVVIITGPDTCIHCSIFYGEVVVESSIQEMLKDRYDFAAS